jgi:hypothetical protein
MCVTAEQCERHGKDVAWHCIVCQTTLIRFGAKKKCGSRRYEYQVHNLNLNYDCFLKKQSI